MWAKARNLRGMREIDADEIKLWLNSLRKEPKPEKQGRRKQAARHGRERKRLKIKHRELRHDHPRILRLAGRGEQAAGEPGRLHQDANTTSAKERRFCRREQVDLLVSECLDREMKFILYCGFHAGLRKGEIRVQAPASGSTSS